MVLIGTLNLRIIREIFFQSCSVTAMPGIDNSDSDSEMPSPL